MADGRSLAEKLQAMAEADESPHEAAIAKAKLDEMGNRGRIPPRRPPAAPAPEGAWDWDEPAVAASNTTNASVSFRVTFNRAPG